MKKHKKSSILSGLMGVIALSIVTDSTAFAQNRYGQTNQNVIKAVNHNPFGVNHNRAGVNFNRGLINHNPYISRLAFLNRQKNIKVF